MNVVCYVLYNICMKSADYEKPTSKSNTHVYITLIAVNPLGIVYYLACRFSIRSVLVKRREIKQ